VSGTVVMSSKVGEVRRPEKCALFGDGQWGGGANKFMRSPYGGKNDENFSGRYAGTQGYRHLGKTNVAWCDGSVRSVEECFTEAHAGESAYIAEGTGFLSPDNSAYDLE
jgi:prepilin-type processing-associated H-X9-DG protein